MNNKAFNNWNTLRKNIDIVKACAYTQKREEKLEEENKKKIILSNSEVIPIEIECDIIKKDLVDIATLYTPQSLLLLTKIFRIMDRYDFRNTSSGPKQKWKSFINVSKNKNNFELLQNISLYDHSLRVMIFALKLAEEYKLSTREKDFAMLIALLHDFGKSLEITNYIGNPSELQHDVRSASFFKQFILSNKDIQIFSEDEVAMIHDTLASQHIDYSDSKRLEENKKYKPYKKLLKLVKKADYNARISEISHFREKEEKASNDS